jgi:hypothetical protein
MTRRMVSGALIGLSILAPPASALAQDAPPPVHCLPAPTALTFGHGSSYLTAEYRDFLDIALRQDPACVGDIVIVGYTPANEPLLLQQKRVMSVFNYLRERGIDPLHIVPSITGMRPRTAYDGRVVHVEVVMGVPRRSD